MKKLTFYNNSQNEFTFGVIKYDDYLNVINSPKPNKYAWVESVLVFLFPYQQQRAKGNFVTAKFAYGDDYHLVLEDYLQNLIINDPTLANAKYEIRIDINHLEEKLCAYLAGLGMFGKNNLIISPEFGSYTVIGTILCDINFDSYSEAKIFNPCKDCNLCARACPTNALDGGFTRERCLSYLTQYSSSDYELYNKLMLTSVGCDICQEVCPYNKKNINILNQFQFNELSIIDINDLHDLNNKTFKEKYHQKAFHWIGYLKMLRNILVLRVNHRLINVEELEYYQVKYSSNQNFVEHIEYLKEKVKCQSI